VRAMSCADTLPEPMPSQRGNVMSGNDLSARKTTARAGAAQEGQTLTTSEAAQRAGLSRERLMRLIFAGKIRARVGDNGRWAVDAASLGAYLKRSA
jgi:excisionase family DNA binding protein